MIFFLNFRFKCKYCAKAFTRGGTLKSHIMMVHMEMDIKEENVENVEEGDENSERVKFVKTKKPLKFKGNKCDQCDKAFAKPYDLKRHINR